MKIDEIFADAVKIEGAADRMRFLDEACAGDSRLRGRVESLLKAHLDAQSFLEAPTGELPPGGIVAAIALAPPTPIAEAPGTVVGRYKLLQRIGEGGMGVVYMAQQERPVRRRVALKIIKPGMDTAQVIARFEAERQALAMMDHPNIARVLDAGCTDTGRPYFVMELVQGIPITKYCDDKQLDTRQRLDLFVEVCHAVQHAHQKGIIHRDLKPSNVLVMIYDSKPVPKIIDFGVAKALHQRLTEATMFTQFGAVVGTLEYMSPEQAEMDALGTDTRSDIYSLGVLLYELLTGSTPMDGKELRSLGYAEMLKTIREVDPPRPSTRLTHSQEAGEISAKRHTELRRLQKLVAGDLDWIVMKCLEKDRTRRYETANGLAMDIQRHLKDEAVTASPPGQFYKFQKLIRRNKLACAATACVSLALMIGLAGSLWQASRAQREAARATTALDDLRAAAPSIAAEARALAAQEKFDEAIGKLDYAGQLRPDMADYPLAKADLLESEFRLGEAAASYRAALKLKPDDARAKANAELCAKLAGAPKTSDGKLTRQTLSQLNEQMLKDERPAAQIMPVARLLGEEKKLIVNYWLERLKDLPNGTDMPLDKRLTLRDDGLLDLNLGETRIADLTPLAGMPLGTLNIPNCKKVTDLTPLHGLPLTKMSVVGTGVTSLEPLRGMSSLQKLFISNTQVSDLSPLSGLRLNWLEAVQCPFTSLEPLRGMPLEKLNVTQSGIVDLSPLAGMPIKVLNLSYTGVSDFSPLKGLPLEELNLMSLPCNDITWLKGLPLKRLVLWNCDGIRNLGVLSDIRTLEVLWLPWSLPRLSLADLAAVENLRHHPSLKKITAWITTNNIEIENIPPASEFWKNWDRDFAWALRLKKANIAFSFGRGENGTWSIDVANQPLTDLSPLAGAQLSWLNLFKCKVTDLSPLAGMPLKHLDLGEDPVIDLSPLKGMKLEWLSLFQTSVHDLSWLSGMPLQQVDVRQCDRVDDVTPLLGCPALENVFVPTHVLDLDPLRKALNIKRISISDNNGQPECTAQTFWKTWDRLPWARKLEAAGIPFAVYQRPNGFFEVTISDPKFSDCSIFKGSPIYSLLLRHSSVADLSTLADMPLEILDLRETSVVDLAPLRSRVLGQSLHELKIWKTQVTDLSPIASCSNLTFLDATGAPLENLSIFKDLRFQTLIISGTSVTDLSGLTGMPLVNLNLDNTPVKDLSPLLKCTTLKSLVLPKEPDNVESLNALRNLERLSYSSLSSNSIYADKTVDEFWGAPTGLESWARKLAVNHINYTSSKLPDGSYQVAVQTSRFFDCSIFAGSAVHRLNLDKTSVADLTPLADLPLEVLSLRETQVTDLSALKSPVLRDALKEIHLWKTKVTDFSPMAGCAKLEIFDASDTAINDLSPLKGMKLHSLLVARTPVADLSIVAGMPLEAINFTGTQVTDVSPLLTCKTLTSIVLPQGAEDVESLRALPKLANISFTSVSGGAPDKTAEKFWAAYDRAHGNSATRPATSEPK